MENDNIVIPKFGLTYQSNNVPADPRLSELKHWCEVFHQKELAPTYENGSYGNLSFRLRPDDNVFIITASALKLKSGLGDDSFVKVCSVDLAKRSITAEGVKPPSSESMLHYAIYAKRSDVEAVFHGHSRLIMERSEQLKYPVTIKEYPYGCVELVEAAVSILGDNNFIGLKNHGFISLGADMNMAGGRALKYLTMAKAIK